MTTSILLSSAAAIITTAGYVPQAYRTIRTRSTASLSLPAYVLLTAGTALWTAYGLLAGNWPIIISNGITAALAGIILAMKLLAEPTEEPAVDGGHPQ